MALMAWLDGFVSLFITRARQAQSSTFPPSTKAHSLQSLHPASATGFLTDPP